MALFQGLDGRSHQLEGSRATIGRDPTNSLVLSADLKVSRCHAEIRLVRDGWVLVDLSSRNGTFVNGQRVSDAHISSGDRVRFGSTEFIFIDPTDPQVTVEESAGAAPRLTARERQVVKLVGSGRTDRQIAEELGIGLSTVRSHLDRIGERTGRRRRSDMTRLALELKLIP